MAIRSKPSNFVEATRAPFQTQLGLFPAGKIVGKDFDNNYQMSWSSASGLTSLDGIRVDASNFLRLGRSRTLDAPKIVKFVMNANGSLADQCFFIADQAYEVSAALEIHSVAGSDGGAVTVDVVKDSSGTAPTGGVSVLASTFDLKATANTYQVLSSSSTPSVIALAAGDRLSVNFTGVLTSVAGLVIEVILNPGYSGDIAVFNMQANTGLADQSFYIANKNTEVTAAYYVHSTAGTNGSAVNLQLTKDTSTNAPGAGTDLLTNNTNAGFDCKGTINVVQTGTLTATTASLRLAPGDRLSADFAGTLTALAGVVMIVVLSPVYNTFDVSFNMNANAGLADQAIFIAQRPCKLILASEVHSTAGTDASAVNLQLTHDRGTDAPGAGTDLVSLNANAGFNLKGTANTVQVATFISSGILYIARGERISLDFAGVLTTLAGLVVTLTFEEA
jgi:hypothetical protein